MGGLGGEVERRHIAEGQAPGVSGSGVVPEALNEIRRRVAYGIQARNRLAANMKNPGLRIDH
jgi:hypothetical protein